MCSTSCHPCAKILTKFIVNPYPLDFIFFYHKIIAKISIEIYVGVERVGYSTRARRVIGGRVSDRITRVLGANHLSARGL